MTSDTSKPTRERRTREAEERDELRAKRPSKVQAQLLSVRLGASAKELEKLRIREGYSTVEELTE
jgi:hypothetical protein